jgi:enolase
MGDCEANSIERVSGRTILDSRGIPTVEAEVTLASGAWAWGRASAASGAAPGPLEAAELRDGGSEWLGKGVDRCVASIENEIGALLTGRDGSDQRSIDQTLIEADGTPDKRRLGANTMLAVSMAVARAAAAGTGLPLWRRLHRGDSYLLPVPLMNVIHGGPTAPSPLDFQEFLIVPHGASSFAAAVRTGAEVYHYLGESLRSQGLLTALGDEGGYCPGIKRTEDALTAIVEAITAAGYEPGRDVAIALDVGSSALWDQTAKSYRLRHDGLLLSAAELTDYLDALASAYPIVSIEDGADEQDWDGWVELTDRLVQRLQLVGDDLFASDGDRLKKGVDLGVANAILIKPNQRGTLTETLDTMALADRSGYACVLSHRSGDTEDQTITELAVATGCGQVKFGAPARGERVSRYNHLIRIEEQLGDRARFAGPMSVRGRAAATAS